MNEADLYISNGECFYGEGQISDPRFLPCGNAAVAGPQACCFQGDFCLSTNVCYDNDTSVTYITGCTDATYSSSKCPHKAGYPDQQWVALARCDGGDSDLFSGCAHHNPDIAVIKHEDCTCNAASALISNPVHGQPTLNQIALLPTKYGGTISFNPTALPTAPASSPGSGSGGLSTGAKAGIGVGVGIGVPLIAATIFLFWFLRRKKRRSQQQQQQGQQPAPQQPPSELPPDAGHDVPKPMQQRSPPPMYSPDSQHAQYGWLRRKPELHGDSAHMVELSANTGSGSANGMDSIQNTPYEIYPPSDYGVDGSQQENETSALQFASSQSTGSSETPHCGLAGGHQRTESSNMGPISEHRSDNGQYL